MGNLGSPADIIRPWTNNWLGSLGCCLVAQRSCLWLRDDQAQVLKRADAAAALVDSHWLFKLASANEDLILLEVGPQNSPRLPKYKAGAGKHGFVPKSTCNKTLVLHPLNGQNNWVALKAKIIQSYEWDIHICMIQNSHTPKNILSISQSHLHEWLLVVPVLENCSVIAHNDI